jgi:predicted SAM-dependent methyltransferase
MYKKLKLNVGCGTHILKGYINIDKVRTHPHMLVADIRELMNPSSPDTHFDSNTVDVILARHVIEHFYEDEIKRILEMFCRMLKPETGKLIIETVDFRKIIVGWQTGRMTKELLNHFLFGFYVYEGTREREPYMMHKYVFDHELLRTFLEDAGFDRIRSVKPPKPFNYDPKYGNFFTGMRFEARKWI